MSSTATARQVKAYDAPDAPIVEITRLSGSGPRRNGDRYRAVVVETAGERERQAGSLGRTLTASFQGGNAISNFRWTVEWADGRSSTIYGDLAFLTVQYGEKSGFGSDVL